MSCPRRADGTFEKVYPGLSTREVAARRGKRAYEAAKAEGVCVKSGCGGDTSKGRFVICLTCRVKRAAGQRRRRGYARVA